MRALAQGPGRPVRIRRRRSPRRSRRGRYRRRPAAVGRGAAVPQPERRSGERVLRRRDHRGRDRAALEDPLAEGDLERLGHAVQATGAEPAARSAPTLEVSTVLEGSVRRAGTGCGSSPQLIDAETDRHLWAETYDRRADRHLRHPDGRRPADRLRARGRALAGGAEQDPAGSRPATSRPISSTSRAGTAYPAGHRGRGPEGPRVLPKRRSRRDPGYALAHAGMALAYAELGLGQVAGRSGRTRRIGGAGRRSTTALDARQRSGRGPCGAGASQVRARLRLGRGGAGVQAGARAETRTARRSTTTTVAHAVGARALRRGDRDAASAPTSSTRWPTGWMWRRRCSGPAVRGGAARGPASASKFDPDYARGATPPWGGPTCKRRQIGPGDQPSCEQAVDAGAREHPVPGPARRGLRPGREGPTRRGRCCDELEEMSRQRYVSPYHMAYVYTGLGEHDRAMDWLERAYEERAGSVYGIKGSFLFTPLRAHPRFRALLGKMNLD